MAKLETLAARLELEQARRDYRATWTEDTANWTLERENSAWEYLSAAYRAWGYVWDEKDEWCAEHDMCEITCYEMHF